LRWGFAGELPFSSRKMIKTLKMKSVHWEAMRKHVDSQAPLEACGLLAGKKGSVEIVIEVSNAAQSPVRFRMDPQEQYNAFMRIEAEGLEILGIYHSHPAGPEFTSATDITEAAYEAVHIIWTHLTDEWRARGFWIDSGESTEVRLQVEHEQ